MSSATSPTLTPPLSFEELISSPWGHSQDNSYYGDPSYVSHEQHGLEHIERGPTSEDGLEKVVILGYN